MANRVLMRPDLVRVSVPGVDVFAANWDQLLFTTERSGMNFFLEGVIAPPNGNGSATVSLTYDLWYGRSLSANPWFQIQCGSKNIAAWSPISGNGNGDYGASTGWGFIHGDFSQLGSYFPDRLRLTISVDKWATPDGPLRYRITDMPM